MGAWVLIWALSYHATASQEFATRAACEAAAQAIQKAPIYAITVCAPTGAPPTTEGK